MADAPSGQAPSFTAKPAIRQQGNGVVFEVRLSANPAPAIVWYHGDKTISDGNRYKIVTQTDGMNYTLMLEISDITPADGGAYKVNAKNKLGESNANINLNLEGKLCGLLFYLTKLLMMCKLNGTRWIKCGIMLG